MIQEAPPAWLAPETVHDSYTVPYETLIKLGKGDPVAGRKLLRALIDTEIEHESFSGPTLRPPNVRRATIADEASLVELLRLDVAENAAHIAPMDDGSLFEFVQAASRDLYNRGAAKPTIGVIGEASHIEGAIFLQPQKWFWSREWFLEERLTVVHEAHRKSHHAAELLQYARWFVDEMSALSGTRVRLISYVVATKWAWQKQALFGRFMTRVGSVYCYPDPSA